VFCTFETRDKNSPKKKKIKLDPLETELYKKASKVKRKTNYLGLDISIEHDKGDIRKGKSWETKMNCSYGYIPRTKGEDGEPIDVYLNDSPDGSRLFIVRQVKEDKSYDEDKVMLGFASKEEARSMYLKHIPRKYLGAIIEADLDNFIKRYGHGLEKKAQACDCDCGGTCNGYNEDEVINSLLEKTATSIGLQLKAIAERRARQMSAHRLDGKDVPSEVLSKFKETHPLKGPDVFRGSKVLDKLDNIPDAFFTPLVHKQQKRINQIVDDSLNLRPNSGPTLKGHLNTRKAVKGVGVGFL
jgi:hypothetical protein